MLELLLLVTLADGTDVRACRVDDTRTHLECRIADRAVSCPYLAPALFERKWDQIPLCPLEDGDRMVLNSEGRWHRVMHEVAPPSVAAPPPER